MFLNDRLTPCFKDDQGNYLIDRSPKYFEPLLNYLRTGKLIIDKNVSPLGVYEEAKYFGVESVLPLLEEMIDSQKVENQQDPILNR